MPDQNAKKTIPYRGIGGPPLPPPRANTGAWDSDQAGAVPTDAQCLAFWDRFEMPDHIRRHSLKVAQAAESMALRALELGREVCVQSVRASALLHDLAKAYTISHGGSHSQLGAVWVLRATGSPRIAQGVLHHVYWPFDTDPARFFLPLAVLYADKRVRHDQVVSVSERYDDLYERYGKNSEIREKMCLGHDQAFEIEDRLSRFLGVDLHEDSFDSGRLVQRT